MDKGREADHAAAGGFDRELDQGQVLKDEQHGRKDGQQDGGCKRVFGGQRHGVNIGKLVAQGQRCTLTPVNQGDIKSLPLLGSH